MPATAQGASGEPAATTPPAAAEADGPGTDAILSLQDVVKRFGRLAALDGLSFDVHAGEIFGIAGPNGAGKSTLLNVATGVLKPDGGTIVFEGEAIGGRAPHRICRQGIARTFQIPQVFASMSIRENVAIGAAFGLAGKPDAGAGEAQQVDAVLDLTGLAAKQNAPAGKVDLLTRKMTMLSAALATRPKLVFMDEPLAGFTRDEITRFADLILHLHASLGITFVLVEHKIRALTRLSHRIMIVHQGRRIALDRPEAVLSDSHVIEVYLGTEYRA